MILRIDLKNCFGIGRLDQTINYTGDGHTAVVYAPNGTMKTSLTTTFKRLIDKKHPSDELYPDRESSYLITIDGVQHDLHMDKFIYDVLQILDRNLTHKTLLPVLFDKSKIKKFKDHIGPSEPNLFNF